MAKTSELAAVELLKTLELVEQVGAQLRRLVAQEAEIAKLEVELAAKRARLEAPESAPNP